MVIDPAKTGPWAIRDWAAAAVLFCATAGVVLWQNAHIVVLWDLSYVLDTAARLAAGQMPYRDFPLVHSPLTFVVQATIMRITGRVLFHHTLYAAMVGGLSTVLTWRLMLRAAGNWWLALVLALPLVALGIYCILPHPSYDCDAAFWTLIALWSLGRLDDERAGWGRGLAAGVLVCMPVFFKQNMGLPFLLAVLGVVLFVLVQRRGARAQAPAGVLLGAAITMFAALVLLHFTAGLSHYFHWTVRFASVRRMPTAGAMLSVFGDPSLFWTLPCLAAGVYRLRHEPTRWVKGWRVLSFLLLAAPFVWALSSLVRFDDADDRGDSLLALWPMLLVAAAVVAIWKLMRLGRDGRMRDFLPLLALAAIAGAFLSQQLWGSTYAIWPLLMLLVAGLLADLKSELDGNAVWIAPALAAVIVVTLVLCGSFYLVSEERLEYAKFPAGPVLRSEIPALKGMSTPGPYVPEMDGFLRYAAANIPADDGMILIPGEDPFYFASGRVPKYPVLLFDPTTDPYSPDEVMGIVHQKDIRWLVVKRDLQIVGNPTPDFEWLMETLGREFKLQEQLPGYDIYRRPASSGQSSVISGRWSVVSDQGSVIEDDRAIGWLVAFWL